MIRFCLSYLPRLLDMAMNPPPPIVEDQSIVLGPSYYFLTAGMVMLGKIQPNPYFVKFLESRNSEVVQRTRKLSAYLLMRLVPILKQMKRERPAVSSEDRAQGRAQMRDWVGLLYCVLIPLHGRPDCTLPSKLKQEAFDELFEWATDDEKDKSEDQSVIWAVIDVLCDEPFRDDVRVNQDHLRGFGSCNMPGCTVEDPLFLCAR